MGMEKDFFWEVFRRTGDPLCWLLTRRRKTEGDPPIQTSEGERRPSSPLS